MVSAAVYAATAMLLAPSIFVAAEWIGQDSPPSRFRRLSYSVLAALLWPLLALGVVQFAVILVVRSLIRSHPAVSPSPLDAEDSDTTQFPRLAVPYVGLGTSAS
jgi:hypothetical protein